MTSARKQIQLSSILALLAIVLGVGCISYDPPPPKPTRAEARLNRARERKPNYAKFGTNKVYYVATGLGPKTIVFIHGWGGNGNFWNEQVPALEDSARLIFIDLPGHGQSDKPEVDYTVDYLADAVLAVMRAARVEQATLVAHSMGVAVACRVYAQAPQMVAALVAVDGSMRMSKISPAEAEKMIAPYRSENYREQVKQSVTSMFPIPGTERLRSQVYQQMMLTPPYVLASTLSNSFQTNQPPWELQKLDVPLLILNARRAGWSPDYEAWVRTLSSKTEYRAFDRVGHFLMLEKPGEFNPALTEMLRRHDLVAQANP